jgi:alpha-tubulin suppressor-like RCC1 family protein
VHNAAVGIATDGQLFHIGLRTDSLATEVRFRDASYAYPTYCGVALDGRGHCWGYNFYGQLGVGQESSTFASAPQPVASTMEWRAIRAGGSSTCGLTAAGEAWCWGLNRFFQLGIGPDSTTRPGCSGHPCMPSPARVQATARFAQLVHREEVSCALTAEGDAWCWGRKPVGIPSASAGQAVRVAAAPAFTKLHENFDGSAETRIIATDQAGAMYALRLNSSATQWQDYFSFVPLSFPYPVDEYWSTESTSCALAKNDRQVYCWGSGSEGALGNGGYANAPRTAPVRILGQAP